LSVQISLSFGSLYYTPSTSNIYFYVLHLIGAPFVSDLSEFFANLYIPWSDKWNPFSIAYNLILRLNMSLPVK
jgi:hypothetical protein